MNVTKKVSPIKEPPLRVAGQSLDERLAKNSDDFDEYSGLCIFMFTLSLLEWWRDWQQAPPSPWVLTILSVIGIACLLPKMKRLREQRRCILQGRDGERHVAEHLDSLRARGYRVLHDVVAGDFNIDHIVIGPTGIFAIETKTLSKILGRKDNAIRVSESQIYINDRPIKWNPVQQAKWNAKWIHTRLNDHTSYRNRTFWVTPVVVFPKWWVEVQTPPNGLYVLNPGQLEHTLSNGETVLNEGEITTAAGHLEDFIRTRQTDS